MTNDDNPLFDIFVYLFGHGTFAAVAWYSINPVSEFIFGLPVLQWLANLSEVLFILSFICAVIALISIVSILSGVSFLEGPGTVSANLMCAFFWIGVLILLVYGVLNTAYCITIFFL